MSLWNLPLPDPCVARRLSRSIWAPPVVKNNIPRLMLIYVSWDTLLSARCMGSTRIIEFMRLRLAHSCILARVLLHTGACVNAALLTYLLTYLLGFKVRSRTKSIKFCICFEKTLHCETMLFARNYWRIPNPHCKYTVYMKWTEYKLMQHISGISL